jgi:hypothetical protein
VPQARHRLAARLLPEDLRDGLTLMRLASARSIAPYLPHEQLVSADERK